MREQTEPERFQSFIPKRSYGRPCPACVGDPGKACLLAASRAHAQGSASPLACSMHYYYRYNSSHCHRQQSAVGTITNEPKHLKGKWRNEMCLEALKRAGIFLGIQKTMKTRRWGVWVSVRTLGRDLALAGPGRWRRQSRQRQRCKLPG